MAEMMLQLALVREENQKIVNEARERTAQVADFHQCAAAPGPARLTSMYT